MPIRVICPSCGRVGQGPERAIGRTVQCPQCLHRHRLTADMVMPEGGNAPPPRPTVDARPRPQGQPSPRPTARPRAGSADDTYAVREEPVAPPKRSIKPPVVPASAPREERGGLHLPVPVLIGGACGVALLSIVAAVAATRMFGGGRPDVEPTKVAAESTAQPSAPAVPPAPLAEPAPVTAPAVPSAPAVAASPFPPVPAAPGMISVAEAMQVTDEVAVTAPPVQPPQGGLSVAAAMPATEPAAPAAPASGNGAPDPESESNVATQARSAAAAVATRDDGAGKTLTTAEIVAESEASVALVKGKGSSGTGFLVGPGLLATNAHVIDDEFIGDLEVRFVSADERRKVPLKAELLYEDAERDLAFLAVKTDLKPLRVAKAYTFRKGEDITVIGNPGLGDGQVLENAISRGVMSTKTQIENRDFYQLGIAINPGNSGGPVFDSSGRVIGVATLKASKQEATGFSIPIEDLQLALSKMAKESSRDADRYRSRHRINCAVKGLGGCGALICIVIDLRRAAAVSNSSEVKEALDKLEPIVTELEKDVFPSLATYSPRVKNDPLVASQVKSKVGEFSQNFARLHDAYAAGKRVDDNLLRSLKQTHRRLITELSGSLKLEVPAGLMTAFDDHTPSQPTTVTMGPQNLGSYGSRLRRFQSGRPSGGLSRPPSLRDRMGPRGRIR